MNTTKNGKTLASSTLLEGRGSCDAAAELEAHCTGGFVGKIALEVAR